MASKQSYDGFEVAEDDAASQGGPLTPTQLWSNIVHFFQATSVGARMKIFLGTIIAFRLLPYVIHYTPQLLHRLYPNVLNHWISRFCSKID